MEPIAETEAADPLKMQIREVTSSQWVQWLGDRRRAPLVSYSVRRCLRWAELELGSQSYNVLDTTRFVATHLCMQVNSTISIHWFIFVSAAGGSE